MDDLRSQIREAFTPERVHLDAERVTDRARRRARQRRVLTGLAAFSVLAVFAGTAVVLARADSPTPQDAAEPTPSSHTIEGGPHELATNPAEDTVFAAVGSLDPTRTGGIIRIDPATRNTADLVDEGGITEIAADADAVYATGPELERVYKYDAATGEELDSLPARSPGPNPGQDKLVPLDLAVGGDWLWLSHTDGTVFQIETDTMRLVAIWGALSSAPGEMAADPDGVWIANRKGGLAHLPAEGQPCTLTRPPQCGPPVPIEVTDLNQPGDIGDVYDLAIRHGTVYTLATTAILNLDSGTVWGWSGAGAVTAAGAHDATGPQRFARAAAADAAYIATTRSRVFIVGTDLTADWVDARAIPPQGPFFIANVGDPADDWAIATTGVGEDLWVLGKSGRITILSYPPPTDIPEPVDRQLHTIHL